MPRFALPLADTTAPFVLAALCALAAGCGRDAATAALPAVEVKVVEVKPQSTEIYRDLVGEVRGSQEVEIRARVTGILTGKHFEDGSIVPEGSLLYTIDAREYRAQVATAEAQLASAEANRARARQDVERYEPLLAENAISQQVYDNAVAAAKEAAAQVTASRAAITEAKLGVEYAQIRAPMTGRIGASQVFEGALITAGQTQLATDLGRRPGVGLLQPERSGAARLPEALRPARARRRRAAAPGAPFIERRQRVPATGLHQLRRPGARLDDRDLYPARRISEPRPRAGAGAVCADSLRRPSCGPARSCCRIAPCSNSSGAIS